jgi:GTP-binding protein HflX
MELPSGKEIVLTDTVGFIQNLPHDVSAAFRATLEEANEADLILHVVDSSTDMRNEQMHVVASVLKELGAYQKEQLTIFNKIDLCEPQELEMLSTAGDFLKISAYSEQDQGRLRIAIQDKLMGESKKFRIPADKGDLISLVYRIGDVLDTEVDENDMLFQVRVNKDDYAKMGYLLHKYDENYEQTRSSDSEGENF